MDTSPLPLVRKSIELVAGIAGAILCMICFGYIEQTMAKAGCNNDGLPMYGIRTAASIALFIFWFFLFRLLGKVLWRYLQPDPVGKDED